MLLPVLPLMMANSPAKLPEYNYKDFSVTLVSEELTDNDYNEIYKYTYSAQNTGDGYIYEIMRGNDSYSGYYPYGIFYPGIDGCLFTNQVIGPHSSLEFYNLDYRLNNDLVVYAANAYTNFSNDVVVTGSFDISLYDEPYYYAEQATYGYFIDMEVMNLNEDKYYYTFILNLEYDGVKYSNVVYEMVNRSNHHGFSFHSRKKLDLSKLSLQDTALVVNQEMYAGYRDPTLNVTAMIIALGTVIGGVAIFSAIYFPIKARKKKENE